jgi:predicted MFS family arabinose efflux permease
LGAGFLLLGIVDVPWLAVPCMLAAGFGFYMFHNTLQTHATQMAPTRRGAAVALFAFCFFVGQSVGVALAAFLLRYFDTGPIIAVGGVGVMLVGLRFSMVRARLSM